MNALNRPDAIAPQNASSVQLDPDTLLHPGPLGFFTEFGWNTATPGQRAHTILRDSIKQIEGAANALYSQCHLTEPGRASGIMFVANALMDQARLMTRAIAVQNRLEDEAGEARSAAASRAARCKGSKRERSEVTQ